MFPPLPPNDTVAESHVPPAARTMRRAMAKKMRKYTQVEMRRR